MNKVTIELTLHNSGHSVSLYCREMRCEYTVHTGVTKLSVAELVREWLDLEQSERAEKLPRDPLEMSDLRSAQWNALRQGKTLSSDALDKIKRRAKL